MLLTGVGNGDLLLVGQEQVWGSSGDGEANARAEQDGQGRDQFHDCYRSLACRLRNEPRAEKEVMHEGQERRRALSSFVSCFLQLCRRKFILAPVA